MKLPKYFYFVVRTTIDGVELIDRSDKDVVEIVRCGECRHRTPVCPENPNDDVALYVGCDLDSAAIHDRYFFCRDGEQKKG